MFIPIQLQKISGSSRDIFEISPLDERQHSQIHPGKSLLCARRVLLSGLSQAFSTIFREDLGGAV